jgi:UDPglucose 6-dehydrogenase
MAVIAQKCPHIQVTVVDLNVRIAAWNDEDLDNILFTNQDWIKLLGSKRKKLILFYGCGKKQLTRLRLFYLG